MSDKINGRRDGEGYWRSLNKIVIGTGQSAECSPHLSYPASAARQIYIEDASTKVKDCNARNARSFWEVQL